MTYLHIRTNKLTTDNVAAAAQLRRFHNIGICRAMRTVETLEVLRLLIIRTRFLAIVHLVQIHFVIDIALQQARHLRRSAVRVSRIVRIAGPHLAAGLRQQTANALLRSRAALLENTTQILGGRHRVAHLVDGIEHVRELRNGVGLQLGTGDVMVVAVDELMGRLDGLRAQFAALDLAFLLV